MSSYQKQFVAIISAWAIAIIVLAAFVMPRVIGRQENLTAEALRARKLMAEQLIQQENIRRAQESMESILGESVKVEDFLPKESTLVGQLASLEKWARSLDLEIKVRLSGTVAAAKKAGTRTEVGLVPLVITLSGNTVSVVEFMRLLESSTLPLVSNNIVVAVDSSSKTRTVRATLEGNVYVQK